MRGASVAISSAAIFALSVSASHATIFTWSYTDGGSNVGSGTLVAIQDLTVDPTGAAYKIQSITGTAQGLTVVGLTSYGTADNYIDWAPGSPTDFDPANRYYHADYYGVGLALAGGLYYDLFEEAGIQPPGWVCGDSSVPYCLLGPSTDSSSAGANDNIVALTDFAVDVVSGATPLPAALPLFASGLGAMGLLGWRRKRKAQLTA